MHKVTNKGFIIHIPQGLNKFFEKRITKKTILERGPRFLDAVTLATKNKDWAFLEMKELYDAKFVHHFQCPITKDIVFRGYK